MKFFIYLCSIFLPFICSLNGEENNRPYFVLKDREGAGMFSMFGDVLALLHNYEQGVFQGVEVDFGSEGLYFDQGHGPNWWNYYCKPIALGTRKNVIRGYHNMHPGFFSPVFFYKNREEAYHLIQKYIHFQPHILEKIEQFKRLNFQDYFVIGIHYRGTDAPESSPSYEEYLKETNKAISSLGIEDYKIFIATDEQPFIDFMAKAFPGRICYQYNALRSVRGGIPLHKTNFYNHYLQGEEAILDCALLSNCSLMILTYSNLSLWACLFNPYAPVIDICKRMLTQFEQ